MENTTAVFARAGKVDKAIDMVAPVRAKRLLESYPDDSVAKYLFGEIESENKKWRG